MISYKSAYKDPFTTRFLLLSTSGAECDKVLNQQLGDGAHFFLKETTGFYVGSDGATKAPKSLFDGDNGEADDEGDGGGESDDEHDPTE